MDIVYSYAKRDMLMALSELLIDQGNPSDNYFHFTDADGELLASIPFNKVQTEGATSNVPRLTFTYDDNYDLEGTIEKTGRVQRFHVNSFEPIDGKIVTIIEGAVGTPADVGADIKFNRIDWIKKNGIEISNITITMENVCLHQ